MNNFTKKHVVENSTILNEDFKEEVKETIQMFVKYNDLSEDDKLSGLNNVEDIMFYALGFDPMNNSIIYNTHSYFPYSHDLLKLIAPYLENGFIIYAECDNLNNLFGYEVEDGEIYRVKPKMVYTRIQE